MSKDIGNENVFQSYCVALCVLCNEPAVRNTIQFDLGVI